MSRWPSHLFQESNSNICVQGPFVSLIQHEDTETGQKNNQYLRTNRGLRTKQTSVPSPQKCNFIRRNLNNKKQQHTFTATMHLLSWYKGDIISEGLREFCGGEKHCADEIIFFLVSNTRLDHKISPVFLQQRICHHLPNQHSICKKLKVRDTAVSWLRWATTLQFLIIIFYGVLN